jgi:1-acyl-sn-glycerol-3-phosphate acyltransferase
VTTEFALSTSDPRLRKTYYLYATPFRRIAIPLASGLLALAARWRAEGVENVPTEGPFVLAANHLTNMDVFFMQFSLSRPIFFMGKEELFRNPIMDWMLRQMGGFPVYRGAHDEWAICHAEHVLEQGQVLGIFPEGTRNRGQGLRPKSQLPDCASGHPWNAVSVQEGSETHRHPAQVRRADHFTAW